jgi:hypothetical protein
VLVIRTTRHRRVIVTSRTDHVKDIGVESAGTRTVYSTALRTGVASERISGEPIAGAPSFEACEDDFRGHYQRNAARRWDSYEIYRVVYRYGYDLGVDPRYRAVEWTTVEQDARPRWEARNPGTWDEFVEMIRYAWDRVRSQRC